MVLWLFGVVALWLSNYFTIIPKSHNAESFSFKISSHENQSISYQKYIRTLYYDDGRLCMRCKPRDG